MVEDPKDRRGGRIITVHGAGIGRVGKTHISTEINRCMAFREFLAGKKLLYDFLDQTKECHGQS